MITGEIKSKVDKLWTTFWNNGISNPLSVIEQISYLLFIKRLDDLELAKERKAQREIKENGYDLSINRYKEIEYEEVKYEPPKVILGKLRSLEAEIISDLDALEKMLG